MDGPSVAVAGDAPAVAARPRVRRVGDDRGIASSIVLFPLFMMAVFMLVHAAWWQTDRQAARAAADHVSSAVALFGSSEGQAIAEGVELMESAGLKDISINVSRGGDMTVVEVSAQAPGLLSGLSVRVQARSVSATEQPPGGGGP